MRPQIEHTLDPKNNNQEPTDLTRSDRKIPDGATVA